MLRQAVVRSARTHTIRCHRRTFLCEPNTALATASLVSHVDVQSDGENSFHAESLDLGWGRVYGGQTMAQVVAACQRIAGPSRVLHQFSCHFLAGGSVKQDLRIEATELASGRSFSFVHARAMQDSTPILAMTASLQTPEDGLDHQRELLSNGVRPSEWGNPRELKSLGEHMAPVLETLPSPRMRALYSGSAPIEMRPAQFVSHYDKTVRPPRRALWLRVKGPLPDELAVHQRLLAYLSDWGLLETALYPHSVSLWSSDVRAASLTHSIHYHRPFRADEWLCHVMESPSAAGARGFATGEVYTEAGVLVASTAQEGLIRPTGGRREASAR